MKTLVTIFCLLAFATSAFAGELVSKVAFSNASAASGAVKTSSVYNVSGYKLRTLHVSGVTVTSSLANPTFGNMSGTVIAQCGPTSNGPWTTCIDGSYAQTAVSRTTSGMWTWQGVSNYIRFQWTAGTTGKKLKLWFNYFKD